MHHYGDYRTPPTMAEMEAAHCLGCGGWIPLYDWRDHNCELSVMSCEDVDEGVNG